jgi:hypothetical protein
MAFHFRETDAQAIALAEWEKWLEPNETRSVRDKRKMFRIQIYTPIFWGTLFFRQDTKLHTLPTPRKLNHDKLQPCHKYRIHLAVILHGIDTQHAAKVEVLDRLLVHIDKLTPLGLERGTLEVLGLVEIWEGKVWEFLAKVCVEFVILPKANREWDILHYTKSGVNFMVLIDSGLEEVFKDSKNSSACSKAYLKN